MRALAFVSLAALLVTSPAWALDAGVDSGLDADLLDGGTDAGGSDASVSDAASDASAKDASSGTDASGQCCPSLPCTCPADGGNSGPDAGDDEGASSGGCSCETAPLGRGTVTPLLLVAGLALARVRRRKRK